MMLIDNRLEACSTLNRQILSRLFAANVEAVAMPVADHREQLGELESRSVSRMVEKRLREYSTGRYCAHKALQATLTADQASSCNVSHYDIAIGSEREPCWPDGVRGSIAHTNDIAAAVVTNDPACRSLGLDIEPLQQLEDGVLKIIADQEELTAVYQQLEQQLQFAGSWAVCDESNTGHLPETAACLVFSAKESIFKCLFPVYRHWLDFREVRVLLEELSVTQCDVTSTAAGLNNNAAGMGECWQGHFRAELTGGCAAAIDVGQLRGQFAVLHGFVVTTAELTTEP